MKKYRGFIFIILIIAGLLIIKFIFFPGGEDQSKGKGAAAGKGIQQSNVEGYVVKKSSVNNRLYVTGSILANEMVELRPEISGKVTSLTLKEGTAVQQGQLLVKINDLDLRAQLKKTQAELKLSGDRLKRLKELINIQGVSQEEYDAGENAVQSLEADAEVLKVQIDRSEIRAPFSGLLGLRNISEGSYVTPLTVVAGIQQLNPVKIDFSVPERYSSLIKQGIKIDFTIEGSDGKFSGVVYAIDPQIDANTRALRVRARADNPDNKLTPGAFARIEILLDNINDAIMIPTQAVVPVLKGQQVFVSRSGIAAAVGVKLGVRQDQLVQVLDSLQSGDTVITTGVLGIRPGANLKFLKVH